MRKHREPRPPRTPQTSGETIRTSYGAADLPIVIFVFALQVVFILFVTYAGIISNFIGDACSERACNFGVMNASLWLIIIGPWVLFAASVLVAGRRRLRGYTAWWVPLLGIAATFVLFVISEVVLYAGTDQL
ncbi:MAG: uncharacterized protein JWN36_2521 [Microbacteriaceae bacterium]|nr:uncharacterized protein [Microbacteriaceae bacterium]